MRVTHITEAISVVQDHLATPLGGKAKRLNSDTVLVEVNEKRITVQFNQSLLAFHNPWVKITVDDYNVLYVQGDRVHLARVLTPGAGENIKRVKTVDELAAHLRRAAECLKDHVA